MEIAKGLGRFFYIINQNETSFKTVEELPEPNYFIQAIPYFVTFMILEFILQKLRNKSPTRLNDGITSLSLGIYWECVKICVRGVEGYVYVQIYNNWRIYDLPWDSPSTWYLAAILVDFFYYWFHRASHEINFFWAHHQVHHSSEDYNLTTAVRQSAFQGWIAWIFYLPMAFFVPPSMYLIHHQFNLLYQFWIHTEVIEDLGPLEFILNTPKHHRIHHGSNRYCLDKNYAGVLIIWDRMFGTFAAEKKDEKIIYGLVEDVNSFNPFWLQFFYFPKIFNRVTEIKNGDEKLSVIFKGPGWTPGKPRLGDPNDCPVYPIRQKFDVKINQYRNVYVAIHFLVIIAGFDYFSKNYLSLNQETVVVSLVYILYTLTSIGMIMEGRKIGFITEFVRCGFIIFMSSVFVTNGFMKNFSILFSLLSMFFLFREIIVNGIFGNVNKNVPNANERKKSK